MTPRQKDSHRVVQGFSFYRIHILQSLPRGELSTGLHLLRFLEDLPGTEGHLAYTEVPSQADLIGELRNIRDHLKATGQIPIIHLETHGSQDGLALASGEFFTWSVLKEVLTEINVACGVNLLVVISACYGENLVRMVRLSDRSPVWGCIGPRTALSAGALQDGFQAFYREMLDSADLRKAIEALDGGLPGVGKPFVLWPTEYFFLVAYRGYLERECTDQRIAERVDWIANHLLLRAAGRVEIPVVLREQIETNLRDYQRFFEVYRPIFFMEDLYPENSKRFIIRFSHVAAS